MQWAAVNYYHKALHLGCYSSPRNVPPLKCSVAQEVLQSVTIYIQLNSDQ